MVEPYDRDAAQAAFAKARREVAAGRFDRAAWLDLMREVRGVCEPLLGAAMQMGADAGLVKDEEEMQAAMAEL